MTEATMGTSYRSEISFHRARVSKQIYQIFIFYFLSLFESDEVVVRSAINRSDFSRSSDPGSL